MRKTVLSLMSLAALAVAGCNGSSSAPQQGGEAAAPASAETAAAAPVAIPDQVSGTITLRDGSPAPSDKATLVLNLQDMSASAVGSAPLATRTSPAGSFPQSFTLKFDPAQVVAGDLYVVQVLLTDGERQYTMAMQVPVLAPNSKNDAVQIELIAQQTPAEKLLAEFHKVEQQLGGMKISNGTKLEADVSRGWQVFREAGEVKFIREDADYGDKGYTRTDYAYKNGRPWVVVQESKAGRNAKPTAIDRAGWVDDGSLLLRQHEAGGSVETLDGASAAKLKKQGEAILKLATNGKGK